MPQSFTYETRLIRSLANWPITCAMAVQWPCYFIGEDEVIRYLPKQLNEQPFNNWPITSSGGSSPSHQSQLPPNPTTSGLSILPSHSTHYITQLCPSPSLLVRGSPLNSALYLASDVLTCGFIVLLSVLFYIPLIYLASPLRMHYHWLCQVLGDQKPGDTSASYH